MRDSCERTGLIRSTVCLEAGSALRYGVHGAIFLAARLVRGKERDRQGRAGQGNMTSIDKRRRWHKRIGRVLSCALLIAACICLASASACAADSPDRPRRILVIPSYNFDYKGIQWFLQGVMAEFAEHKPFKTTLLLENLQLAAHPTDQKYMDTMAASLKIKYSLEKPDLIIAQYKQAFQFMERYGKDIFGEVPVVFAGLSVEGLYTPERLPDHYTGIVASFSASKNIELILRNHPAAKRIYVVGGASPVEQSLVDEAIKEGAAYRGKIEFVPLYNMPFPALLAKLGEIEDDSVVMYQALQLDAAGKVFVPALAAIDISRASRVPVYCMLDTYMGSGIVGGFLIHHEGLGRRAAEIAVHWLQAGVIPDTRVKSEPIGSYRFDGRQLERWRIAERKLPSVSHIEFKTFSVWDSYRKEIIGGVFLLLLQTTLIVGLMRSRYRRIKAEEKLRESEEKYRLLVENANEAVYVLQEGKYKFANRMCSEMLGVPIAELIGASPLEFLHPDDREKSIVQHRRFMNGELTAARNDFRVLARGGGERWADVNSVGIQWEGKIATLNFATDITERKRSEEMLRNSEDQFRRAVEFAPFPIMIHAEDGEVIAISQGWTELSGYAHRDIPTIDDWAERAYGPGKQAVMEDIEALYHSTDATPGRIRGNTRSSARGEQSGYGISPPRPLGNCSTADEP